MHIIKQYTHENFQTLDKRRYVHVNCRKPNPFDTHTKI